MLAVSIIACAGPVATDEPSPSASEDEPLTTEAPVADPVLAEFRARPSILGEIDMRNGCPVSMPQRVNGATFSALGSEPFSAGGLNARMDWDDAIEIDGDRYLEVSWLSEPHYSRQVLVRGIDLETGAPVEFRSSDGAVTEELYLMTATSTEVESIGPGFRTWAASVSVPEPGCYAIQVEARDHIGAYTIVFEVTQPEL